MNPTLDYISEGLPFFTTSQSEDFEEKGHLKGGKLYLVPTTHGDRFDPDFSPIPTPISELPDINRWTRAYVITAIEVIAGRRSIVQLARSTHRFTYNEIASKLGSFRELPRVQRIHRSQPIEGVVELTVTLKFEKRVRALAARFEGVDRRWICTEFYLL